MKQFGEFLSNLRSSAGLSLEELGKLVGTSRSTLSRLENNDIPRPFKSAMRQLVLLLAELLCTSQKEAERYLEVAAIDRSYLTDTEEVLLGFIPSILAGSPEEASNLERLRDMYEQRYHQLDEWEQQLQQNRVPPIECNAQKQVRRKKRECALLLKEVQQRLSVLTQKWEEQEHSGKTEKRVYAPGDTIVVALAPYLEQQRARLLDALAPGSINLRVKDIVGNDGLFIRPTWKVSGNSTSSTDIVEYLTDVLTKGQRVLVLGEAGQGKTILLKQLFTWMVDRFLNEPEHLTPIPLYIPLREFSTLTTDVFELLWSYIGEGFPLSFETFVSLIRTNQIVLLLDGFDEVRGELTQRSINERASSKLFTFPTILTCRKNFYEFYLSMSALREQYPQKVELLPFKFTDLITHYITAFCDWKGRNTSQKNISPPEKISEVIQSSLGLQDLAQRPLLLAKMLDIFTEPHEAIADEWNTSWLYQTYTEKWLKNEAAKADSVLKWHEKAALIQEVAWSTYTSKTLVAPTHKLNENITFTYRDLSRILERFASRYQPLKFVQLVDDICFRTFLIADGDTYYFIHESFQEYYVARYIFEHLVDREGGIEAITHVIREFLPVEVVSFLKSMLNAKDFSKRDKELLADTLIKVYRQNYMDDFHSSSVRQNASTYLAFLGTQKAVQFLETTYQQEPNKWVQRGMMIGLALYCGRMDVLEQYIDKIRTDSDVASINIGYHLVYYGDQAPEEIYSDRGSEKCDETVRALFRHLRNLSYKTGWALDLLTLRMLLERRGMAILSLDGQYLPFLKAFLCRDYQEKGNILQHEQKLLQDILENAGLL